MGFLIGLVLGVLGGLFWRPVYQWIRSAFAKES